MGVGVGDETELDQDRLVNREEPGKRLLAVGVIVSTFGVAVTMLPGAYNPFGPAKAVALLLGCTCVAAGLLLAPDLATRALRRSLAQRGAWAGWALIAVTMLATFTSLDPSQSLVGHYPEYQGLLLLLASALVGFGVYALAETERAWRLFGRAAVVATFVVAGYAALQFAGADPVAYERIFVVRRVRSTLGNASNLGVWLCLALPMLVARARAEKGPWRWASLLAVAFGAIVLAWSLSRGAWLGALAGTCAWLIAEGRRWERARRVRTAVVALASVAVVFALVIALVPAAGGRLSGLLDPSSGTPGWRAEVWAASTRLVAIRPLLGYGPGSFRYAFPPIRTAAMQVGETGTQALDDPHNLLVSAAVSAGVAGLLALAWLLAEGALAAWRLGGGDERGPVGPALAVSIVAGAVALQFHFATIDTAPLLAAVIGCALAGASGGEPAVAPPTPRARAAARAATGLLVALLAAATVLAGGLALADRQVAASYSAVSAERPWSEARTHFARAEGLASWEPAMTWAGGRAATEAMTRTASSDSFTDAGTWMSATVARLPLDPLAWAQLGDVYLIGGLVGKDSARLDEALPVIEHAIALDPQNGYRWAAKATALAALGRTGPATEAYLRAVQYAPNDAQAWAGLASMYERAGQAEKAAEARERGAALLQDAAQ